MTSQPNLVLLNKGEYFLIRNSILIPNNQELLVILHQLRHILPEQRKRGISDYDVGFFQEFYALSAAKISITLERQYTDFFRIGNAITILVALVNQIDRFLALSLREQIDILILVAGSYQFLQAEVLKVVGKVREEIADARVVAVAQHGLAAKVLAVVPQLIVDVLQLSIELILLSLLGLVQILVCHPVVGFYPHYGAGRFYSANIQISSEVLPSGAIFGLQLSSCS